MFFSENRRDNFTRLIDAGLSITRSDKGLCFVEWLFYMNEYDTLLDEKYSNEAHKFVGSARKLATKGLGYGTFTNINLVIEALDKDYNSKGKITLPAQKNTHQLEPKKNHKDNLDKDAEIYMKEQRRVY